MSTTQRAARRLSLSTLAAILAASLVFISRLLVYLVPRLLSFAHDNPWGFAMFAGFSALCCFAIWLDESGL